jgi:hypothetical protein
MAVPDRKITRSDIEAKLREIKGDVESEAEAARPYAIAAAVVGVIAVAGLAYFLGRRKGHKKTTVVEIRRV